MQKFLKSEYLMKHGYSSDFCDESFDKFKNIEIRKSLYSEKIHKDKNSAVPLVMDNNPALPNMGSIIHNHKHLLDLDPELKKHVNKASVFVSYRKNKTIGDMLIHNRFKPSKQSENSVAVDESEVFSTDNISSNTVNGSCLDVKDLSEWVLLGRIFIWIGWENSLINSKNDICPAILVRMLYPGCGGVHWGFLLVRSSRAGG